MTEKVFVDSNILVYAHDAEAGKKQRKSAELLDELWASQSGVVSVQVLQEFYVTVTRKLHSRVPRAVARSIVSYYSAWSIEPISPDVIVAASLLEEQAQLSFWDALIIVTASRAGARILYSEDLGHGQTILGVRVENPFAR